MIKPLVLTVLSVMIITFCVQGSFAQISITQLGAPITEDFNTLPSADGDYPITNNIFPLPGWYFSSVWMPTGDGASSGAGIWSYGRTPIEERALGSLTNVNFVPIAHSAMVLRNDSGILIRSFIVEYTGEQWRRAGNSGQQEISFSYQVTDSLDNIDLVNGIFVPVPSLTFFCPIYDRSSTSRMDGNLAANRQGVAGGFTAEVQPGEFIILRWSKFHNGETSHGLAIDDLSVTPRAVPTAAAVGISGCVSAANGVGLKGVSVAVEGAGVRRRVTTSSFGDFRIEGLTAGETYVVSVASRRHAFPKPAQIVTLNDEMTKLEFTAFPTSEVRTER